MKLFGKKEKNNGNYGKSCTPEKRDHAEARKTAPGVKVLGSGCSKCNALEAAVREALTELHMDANIDHISDVAQIASYGVMSTPALVIDGKVVSVGKILKKDDIITLLNTYGEPGK